MAFSAFRGRICRARDTLLAVQSDAGGFPNDVNVQTGSSSKGSFDDNTTTGALDFLLDLWLITQSGEDRKAAESVADFLLTSQYSDSGGWPQ